MKSIKIKLFALALLAVGLTFTTTTSILARGNNNNNNNNGRITRLAYRIAERFDLEPEEVQEVINENREDREERRDNRFRQRLENAVRHGEITREQMEVILATTEDMSDDNGDDRDEDNDNNREAEIRDIQARYVQLAEWAEQNNVDPRYITGTDIEGIHIQPGPDDKFIFISLVE